MQEYVKLWFINFDNFYLSPPPSPSSPSPQYLGSVKKTYRGLTCNIVLALVAHLSTKLKVVNLNTEAYSYSV